MKYCIFIALLTPLYLSSQSFAPPVSVFYNSEVNILTSIKAADIDKDEVLDLIMSTADINSFWIKGQANTVFGPANIIFNDEIFGEEVVALDADGDGDMDVVTATSFSNDVIYSENIDGESFAQPVILAEDQFPMDAMILLDVDNDEDEDLLVSGYSAIDKQGSIFLLRNNGDGTFQYKETLVSGITDCRTISFGDFDGDEDQDLVVGTYWDKKLFWAENNGSGHFSNIHEILPADSVRTYATAVSDVDNDGDIDILQSASGLGTMLYLNDGNGNFAEGEQVNEYITWYFDCADIDSDGDEDIIQGHSAEELIVIFTNNGSGKFNEGTTIASEIGVLNNLDIVDWDGDGDLDFFTSSSLYDEFLFFENLIDIPLISGKSEIIDFGLYPNPNDGYFFISSYEYDPIFFRINNLHGEEIYAMTFLTEKSKKITLEMKGIFIIQFFDKKKEYIGSKKLVIH